MTTSQPAGFLAAPPSGTGKPVLVLHAWWGLNETIRKFCTQLAAAGFTAFAPDLYHGQVADTIPAADELSSTLDLAYARTAINSAVTYLTTQAGQPGEPLTVIGFSLGAFLALDLSVNAPDSVHSVVIYYGTGPDDYTKAKAAYLGHFAETDPYEPAANVAWLQNALEQADRSAEFHTYPGTGHWFCEPDREDAYNPEAAQLAWERTLAFLNRTEE